MKDEYDFSEGKRGQILDSSGKTRITIWLNDEILAEFRARAEREGKGYQTLINDTLMAAISHDRAQLTVDVLRRVLREELAVA